MTYDPIPPRFSIHTDLLDLTLETTKSAIERFAFLQLDFCHSLSLPSPMQRECKITYLVYYT